MAVRVCTGVGGPECRWQAAEVGDDEDTGPSCGVSLAESRRIFYNFVGLAVCKWIGSETRDFGRGCRPKSLAGWVSVGARGSTNGHPANQATVVHGLKSVGSEPDPAAAAVHDS